ncbi:MAG TPA: hypothetical protein VKB87_17110 [Myxococcaceae bacterium]|nr:hypothetical protein [Myxococcaceae bacterium]
MNAFKSLIVGLPLFSLFTGALVRADDCRDALTAEPCACQSTERPLAERAKKNIARLEETSAER